MIPPGGSPALWPLLLLSVSAVSIPAQHFTVLSNHEPLPARPPQSPPEHRRKLGVDPDALFTKLVSKDPKQTADALKGIEMSWLAERRPTELQLVAVNVDADDDLERLLIVTAGFDSAALVLKKDLGEWWALGSFVCCGPGARTLNPFIELKETVWHGTKDLIVHGVGAHGSGVGEMRQLIYRVWKGQLYKVLDVVEGAYNLAGSERTRIVYPNVDSQAGPRVLVVHRIPEAGNRRNASCTPYRWDSAKFAFIQTAATKPLCGSAK